MKPVSIMRFLGVNFLIDGEVGPGDFIEFLFPNIEHGVKLTLPPGF